MNPINHVAIIMDGNGRWGLQNKRSRNYGHKQGLKTTEKIINSCIDHNIKFLTLFVFSTENWQRPKKEIDNLFFLLENFLNKNISKIIKNNIKIKFFGNRKNFSEKLKKILKNSENLTKKNTKIQVNLALNYGSQDEIVNAVKILVKKKISITKKNISCHLYTKNLPNPDFLVRTGNTKRLSNFLLWQLSYTEIYFHKKLWPDFDLTDFNKIIMKFKKVKRNFGQI